MVYRGCDVGSAHMRVAALRCSFLISRSIGGVFAWTSKTSNAVPLMPPVMYLVAMPWMLRSSFVSLTEPLWFFECALLYGGVNHTSAA